MSLVILVLLLVLGLVGCSTRNVVVKPEEVSKLNDPQWTIKLPPAGRTR
jgi:hypothetical protein